MKDAIGNPKSIRENNQKILAQYLFEYGTTSRSKLAEVFHLSAPSIYKNISQLIDQNIVLEIGEGGSKGGRRPMLISFNYDMGYIVSIDLKGECLKLALSNLALTVIGREEIPIHAYTNGHELFLKAIEVINQLMEQNHIEQDRLLSIAIGMPGSINQQTGQVNMPPMWFNLGNVKYIEELIVKAYPSCRIIIKNDINMAAIGEMRYGTGKGCKNFVYISVDMGVGAGIILNGHLYEGSRFSSGEIGYSKTGINSADILENEISVRAIMNQIMKNRNINEDNRIEQFLTGDKKTLNLEGINKALHHEDKDLLEIMDYVTQKLCLILTNICTLLDIELIIIDGKIVEIDYDFKSKLRDMINKNLILGVKMEYSSLKGNEVILGGFGLSLDEILKEIAIY